MNKWKYAFLDGLHFHMGLLPSKVTWDHNLIPQITHDCTGSWHATPAMGVVKMLLSTSLLAGSVQHRWRDQDYLVLGLSARWAWMTSTLQLRIPIEQHEGFGGQDSGGKEGRGGTEQKEWGLAGGWDLEGGWKTTELDWKSLLTDPIPPFGS